MDGKVGVVSLAKPPHNLIDDELIEDLLAAYRNVLAEGARDLAPECAASLLRRG
jgi:hypothetical protein